MKIEKVNSIFEQGYGLFDIIYTTEFGFTFYGSNEKCKNIKVNGSKMSNVNTALKKLFMLVCDEVGFKKAGEICELIEDFIFENISVNYKEIRIRYKNEMGEPTLYINKK